MQRTEGLPGAVARALALAPPPDRATALHEARRLAATGHADAALHLVRWAAGPDAPGTPADADAAAPWAALVDCIWIAAEAGASPSAEQRQKVRAALLSYAQRGGKPFNESWTRAFELYGSRGASPDPMQDQEAVWLLLRARWLSSDPLYATVLRALRESELDELEPNAWKIEYELFWWYRHALDNAPRAAAHGGAAVAAWDRFAAAGRRKEQREQEADRTTFSKLAECADAAGDAASAARFTTRYKALTGGGR